MDSDRSDDSDLRAAIAASLDDARATSNNQAGRNVVDLTGDSEGADDVIPDPKSKSVIGSETSRAESENNPEGEDEDLRRAIAMSLQEFKGSGSGASTTASHSPKDSKEEPVTASWNLETSFLGLDRNKMEEERLARFSKRKAENAILVGDEPKTKQLKTGIPPEPHPNNAGDKVAGLEFKPSHLVPEIAQVKQQILTPSPKPSFQFPSGVVKKTFAFGCPRVGDDIKIEEVFQKSDLELAVLSSFMWDMDWLFSKLDAKTTRFLLIMQAKDDATSVFLIDLPKRDRPTSGEESNTNFYRDLVYFLGASTLHQNIISKLDNFDFSKTSQFAFVHTIGGSHTGTSWKRTGYCGLGRSLDSLGLRVSKPINIDFVTSSLGSLTEDFMRAMYFASQGDDGTTELAIRTAKSFPVKNPSNAKRLIQRATADEWRERFRVYFPSQDTINKSKGGPENAGTVCFQSKWYEGPKFPRHVLRDCESERPGLLMHNKILYVRLEDPISLSDHMQCKSWAYVGSANLSESAWGRLVQDRANKQPRLNCRNWECGVIIPVMDKTKKVPTKDQQTESSPKEATKDQNGSTNNLPGIFHTIVPVPMRLPGARYSASRRPWYFLEAAT